ncbi:MAG: hypothetical protein ACRC1K_23720, partial [Planctomycetia bacterium]
DGAGKLWFTNRKTNTRLYVSVGEVLEAEGFRGDVVEASPDQAVLRVGGRTGVVRLGRSLATWREIPASEIPASEITPAVIPAADAPAGGATTKSAAPDGGAAAGPDRPAG